MSNKDEYPQLNVNNLNPVNLPCIVDVLYDEDVDVESMIGAWFGANESDDFVCEFDDQKTLGKEITGGKKSRPHWCDPDYENMKIMDIGEIACRHISGETDDGYDVELNVFYRTKDKVVVAWTMRV